MGGVEHHRRAGGGEHGQRAQVGHERVVAETRAAFGHEHVGVAGGGHLRHHVGHVPRGQELALLHVHYAAGVRGRHEQIGLTAQEGGNLQHVDDRRDLRALLDRVHVGEHRQAGGLTNLCEHGQRGLQAQSAFGRQAGAVGLVEAGLEDQAGTDPVGDFAQGMRHLERVAAAFHLARTGDEHERQGLTQAHGAAAGHGDLDDRVGAGDGGGVHGNSFR